MLVVIGVTLKKVWDPDIHPPTKIKDIVINVKKSSDIVVITGGEPLMWDMNPITKLLNENNIKTHIETSGAYKFSGNWELGLSKSKKKQKPS